MVRLCAKEHVVIAGDNGIGRAIHFKQTVEGDKREVEPAVILYGKTPDEVEPDNPISIRKEVGEAQSNGFKLAEEEEQRQIKQQTVDENVVVLPHVAQLIEITKHDDTGKQTFQITDTQSERCAGYHFRVLADFVLH